MVVIVIHFEFFLFQTMYQEYFFEVLINVIMKIIVYER